MSNNEIRELQRQLLSLQNTVSNQQDQIDRMLRMIKQLAKDVENV